MLPPNSDWMPAPILPTTLRERVVLRLIDLSDLATCAIRSTRASERPHFIRSADAANPAPV
jgi:hypothetical protein